MQGRSGTEREDDPRVQSGKPPWFLKLHMGTIHESNFWSLAHSTNTSINDGAVCRTAPDTMGRLVSKKYITYTHTCLNNKKSKFGEQEITKNKKFK